MKKSEVNNNHKHKYGKIKASLSIRSFKRKRSPDGRLMKHKSRLFPHGGMKQWGVTYWETYDPVVNWISVRSLLVIASRHELTSRSIEFVLPFNQGDLDVNFFMDIPL